jgi:LPPG:FO 2-phospho-L-lactate transferase
MTDSPVATIVETPEGPLAFQDYFVRRRQQDDVTGVAFEGTDRAAPLPEALGAIARAAAVVIAPSNPIVSIGPMLAVQGYDRAVRDTKAPVVAVSPIVGGKALKGPADRMLTSLGHESSALGVARLYAGLVDGFVIDHVDAALAPAIEALGMRVLVTNAIMTAIEDRARLGREVIDFAADLAANLVATS